MITHWKKRAAVRRLWYNTQIRHTLRVGEIRVKRAFLILKIGATFAIHWLKMLTSPWSEHASSLVERGKLEKKNFSVEIRRSKMRRYSPWLCASERSAITYGIHVISFQIIVCNLKAENHFLRTFSSLIHNRPRKALTYFCSFIFTF